MGVGGMVLTFGGSPDMAIGFLISKIITQQYRFQEKQRKFKRFGG